MARRRDQRAAGQAGPSHDQSTATVAVGQHRRVESQGENGGRVLRLLALIAVAGGVIALTAGACVLSYTSVHDLALHAGVSGSLAKIYPGIADAMLVIAGCAVLALRGAGLISKIYAWLCFIVLLAAIAAGSAIRPPAFTSTSTGPRSRPRSSPGHWCSSRSACCWLCCGTPGAGAGSSMRPHPGRRKHRRRRWLLRFRPFLWLPSFPWPRSFPWLRSRLHRRPLRFPRPFLRRRDRPSPGQASRSLPGPVQALRSRAASNRAASSRAASRPGGWRLTTASPDPGDAEPEPEPDSTDGGFDPITHEATTHRPDPDLAPQAPTGGGSIAPDHPSPASQTVPRERPAPLFAADQPGLRPGQRQQPTQAPEQAGPPTRSRPMRSGPKASRPMASRPMLSRPMASRPMLSRPMLSRPMASRPMLSRPMLSRPMASRPMASRPMASRPARARSTLPQPSQPRRLG